MNPKNTWLWVALAAGLFAFIFFFERHLKSPDAGPRKVLPGLKAAEIQRIRILPKGHLPIQVERTNGAWRLTQPIAYPAEAARIEGLLKALAQLTAATYIPVQELKNIPDEDAGYGFDEPQFSIMLGQRQRQLLIGRMTAFGDQAFVKVAGGDGVYVVDGRLLRWIPRQANDWRQTALVRWDQLTFDRFVVTNGGKVLDLQLNPASLRWRIVSPMPTRADVGKVQAALQQLGTLNVQQFVSDDPKADLDGYGLLAPEISLTFFKGTNAITSIDFGRSPTNAPDLAFARLNGQDTIVTVPRSSYQQWLASSSDSFRAFFDRHLVMLSSMPDTIEVRGRDTFTIQRETTNSWRVMTNDFEADPALLNEFITSLTNLQGEQIVREVVTDPDLPAYALSPPSVQYILKATQTNDAGIATNIVLAQIDFGITNAGSTNLIYARRGNDLFVFSVNPTNTTGLKWLSWQLRNRQVWNFSEEDVAGLTIRQRGRTWQLVRLGRGKWRVAPGSQGMIDEVIQAAIEETVHRVGNLSAAAWVQRGEPGAEFGFKEADYEISIELKSGEKRTVKFGKEASSKFPYAEVTLDGDPWVLEFPWITYQYVEQYLKVPAYIP